MGHCLSMQNQQQQAGWCWDWPAVLHVALVALIVLGGESLDMWATVYPVHWTLMMQNVAFWLKIDWLAILENFNHN